MDIKEKRSKKQLISDILIRLKQIEDSINNQNTILLKSASFVIRRDIEDLIIIIAKEGSNQEKSIVSAHEFYEFVNFIEAEILLLSHDEINSDQFYFKLFKDEFFPTSIIVKDKIKELLELISLDPITVKHSSTYDRKLKKNPYLGASHTIKKTEISIINYFEKGGKIGQSNYAKISREDTILHSWIPAPMDDYRIEYIFNPQKREILFLDIGRAGADLGYSGH